jgi:hypothetical protein
VEVLFRSDGDGRGASSGAWSVKLLGDLDMVRLSRPQSIRRLRTTVILRQGIFMGCGRHPRRCTVSPPPMCALGPRIWAPLFSLRIRDEAVPRANPGEEQDRHGGSEWAERARNRNASTTIFQLLPLPSMGPRNLPPHLDSPKAPHQLAPPRRHDSSPSGAFVRIEMATSRHLVREQGAAAAQTGSPPPAGCGDAVVPRDRQVGRRGFEAESRRERWSPEPRPLMGGALGDDGGEARPRLAASRPNRLKGDRERGGGTTAESRLYAIPAERRPKQTARREQRR